MPNNSTQGPTFKKILFFNVGPPKEDIFSGHLLSPVFQSLSAHSHLHPVLDLPEAWHLSDNIDWAYLRVVSIFLLI